MSLINSDLSSVNPSPDFVIAITQKSVNASLKQLLAKQEQRETILYFVKTSQGQPEQIDFDSLRNTGGVLTDPFAIKSGTRVGENSTLRCLQDANFLLAVKVHSGLPRTATGKLSQKLPEVLTLLEGTQVNYTLLFSNFTIAYLEGEGDNAIWTSRSQTENNLYSFNIKVDLKLGDVNRSQLNEYDAAVKEKIRNFGNDAFSIKQLFFDLENSVPDQMPEIEGINKGTPLYNCLPLIYKQLIKQRQTLSLGTLVQNKNISNSSINMAGFNFMISPYQSNGSEGNKQKGLATLNYICSSSNKNVLNPGPFPWNWVDDKPGEVQADGALSIKRDVFLNWLRSAVAPSFQSMCLRPQCDISAGWTISYSLNFLPEDSKYYFNIIPERVYPDGFKCVMKFTYESSSEDSYFQLFRWGNMECRYKLDSEVFLRSNSIKLYTYIDVWLHMNYQSGITEGRVVQCEIENVFDITVDGNGRIAVVKQPTIIKDYSQRLEVSTWSNIFSFGRTDDMINVKEKFSREYMKRFINILDSIEGELNGPASWVFPAGNSFTFKDVQLSRNLDLVAGITYTK